MHKRFFTSVLLLPVLAAAAPAVDCLAIEPFDQSFGYPSDEMAGGGSYLGVDTRDVTPDRVGALKLKEERGVEVTMVDQDAPAGKAGLKEHDVILNVNGAAVESVEQLRRIIHEIPAGRTVSVGVSRDGQSMTVKAQLADRKKAFVSSAPGKEFKFVMPAMPAVPNIPEMDMPVSVVVVHSSLRSGLMVENLTPQLSEFFGVKTGQGVLVRSVEKGSRAEQAGFHAGDVIVKVNGEVVNDSGDFGHAVRKRKDNVATVGIVRDHKEQSLTLTLPDRGPSSEFFEESFEFPMLSAESRNQMMLTKSEVARMKPEMERFAKEMRENSEQIKKNAEEMTRDWEEKKDEIQRELREEFYPDCNEI